MSAYDESYIEDAMCTLGELFHYAVHYLNYDIDEFMSWFMLSGIAALFEVGHPKYVAGKSGMEIAYDIIVAIKDEKIVLEEVYDMNRSMEYWAGWILAYYQWKKNISFQYIAENGLTMSKICDLYVLHEANVDKFVEAADSIIECYKREHKKSSGHLLKYYRSIWGLSQKQLSEKSGVSLRMIQLYEQGQNDLAKASVAVVDNLAKALGCQARDLYL